MMFVQLGPFCGSRPGERTPFPRGSHVRTKTLFLCHATHIPILLVHGRILLSGVMLTEIGAESGVRWTEQGGEMEKESIQAKDRSQEQRERWIQEQEMLKKRLVLNDDFPWQLSASPPNERGKSNERQDHSKLRYVGGVDLSFAKEDSSLACGALVVLDLEIMQIIYEDFDIVQLTMPYLAGFLAFRETPVLLGLLKRMALKEPALYPQLVMVDGNGILHPRGFGLASHLGILADIPTIGVGKNLHHVDGLTNLEVRHVASESNLQAGDAVPLIGSTGQIWGAALRSHEGCQKPVYVSIGHRISLDTALAVVRRCCIHRVPEPVRQRICDEVDEFLIVGRPKVQRLSTVEALPIIERASLFNSIHFQKPDDKSSSSSWSWPSQ